MLEGMIRDDEERKRIGNVIQVLRVQQGLTVDELAKKSGVGSSLLARVELGKLMFFHLLLRRWDIKWTL